MNELPITEQPTPIPAPEPIAEESEHRGNGKVARLPKGLRDQVNCMLDDGLSYKAIIEKLEQSTDPPLPYKLLEMNISRWKDNGYQRYLRHQEWRDDLRILRESGSEMSELADGSKFQETLVQIALTEIFRVLQQRELKSDSLNFIRLFNSLARLNREALGLRKYNDLLAKEQAELKKLDVNRDISNNEHRAIADRADRIFRMPRPRPDGTANDHAPSQNPKTETPEPAPRPRTRQPGKTQLTRKDCATKTKRKREAAKRPARSSSNGDRASCNTKREPKIEKCLDCGSALPPVPPKAQRRPDDHCPSCGTRLPDIGLCDQPGFDHCLSCGTSQPHLLPNGERPRPNCHKCGERLHNPEIPNTNL